MVIFKDGIETTEEHPCIFTSKNDKIEVEK